MARVVIDSSAFEAEIEGVIARARDARRPLEAWARHMVGSVKRNFQDQGRPSPWRPLKVNTLVARFLRKAAGRRIEKTGGQFAPNPNLYKESKGKLGAGKLGSLGDVSAVSTVAGMARSSKTGRVLRARHGGLNKIAPAGMVFRRPALRAIMQGQILLDSGRLRSSIAYKIEGPGKVGVGTNVKYAGAHQFGSTKKQIPARPFLVIQEDDREEFIRLIREHVMGVW